MNRARDKPKGRYALWSGQIQKINLIRSTVMQQQIPTVNMSNLLSQIPKSTEIEWMKAVNGELVASGKNFGPEVIGTIYDVKLQWSKYIDGQFVKKDLDCPPEEREGFYIEATLYFRVDGKDYGITISKSNTTRQFSPYVEMLSARNVNLATVATRIAVSQFKATNQPYHIFSFALHDSASGLNAAA